MDPSLSELTEAYRSGELVLFVGAGISAAAGLPSWKRLTELLIEHAKARGADEADIEEAADLAGKHKFIDTLSAIKHLLGGPEFCAAVERHLDDRPLQVPEVGRAIAGLAPRLRTVLTTNIDHLLERSFQGTWPAISRSTGDMARQRQCIIKLHGTLKDRSTWVFTRDEYDRAMYADPKLKDAFSALFHACPLLFVGFGLADDNFDALLQRVRAFAGDQPPRHFALVPSETATSYRRRILGQSGISLVLYPNTDGRHAELTKVLQSIATGAPPDPVKRAKEPPKDTNKSHLILPGVSELAQRIVDERAGDWEYRLFSQILADELQAAQPLRRDLDLGVAFGESLSLPDVEDVATWMSAQFVGLSRIFKGMSRLVKVGLADAVGPPGQPGSPEKLKYVADRIAYAYKEIIAWCLRWKYLNANKMFSNVVECALEAGSSILGQIEAWSAKMQSVLAQYMLDRDKIIAAGQTVTIDLSAKLEMPDDLVARMHHEIERISAAYRDI